MIYFIQNETTRAVKIGKSNDPVERLRAHQVSSGELLTLLGTMEGNGPEEQTLHALFNCHHQRGEWFKGSPELLEHIKLLLVRKGTAATLWDDAKRRDGCRFGLPDLRVAMLGTDETFRIYGSHWNEASKLTLILYPSHLERSHPPTRGNGLFVRGSDVVKWSDPMGPALLHDIPAESCVLLDYWPVTCCEPTS